MCNVEALDSLTFSPVPHLDICDCNCGATASPQDKQRTHLSPRVTSNPSISESLKWGVAMGPMGAFNRSVEESGNEHIKPYVPSNRISVREAEVDSDADAGNQQSSRIRRVAMESSRTASNGKNVSLPGSGDPHVQEVVRAAHEELRQLMRQRADIMKRIGTVKQTIVGLANLFGDGVLSEELMELVDRKSNGRQPGFTKACRMILMESDRAMNSRDICDYFQEKLPDLLARHKDPMASVTTVLNRLVEYGEAEAVVANGRRAWRWVADAQETPRGNANQ